MSIFFLIYYQIRMISDLENIIRVICIMYKVYFRNWINFKSFITTPSASIYLVMKTRKFHPSSILLWLMHCYFVNTAPWFRYRGFINFYRTGSTRIWKLLKVSLSNGWYEHISGCHVKTIFFWGLISQKKDAFPKNGLI